MQDHIKALLLKDRERFLAKGLFVHPDDSLSMRVPGTPNVLLVTAETEDIVTLNLTDSTEGVHKLHCVLMKNRLDVGAILISQTPWSEALATFNDAMPTLFDEPARHIGPVSKPLDEEDEVGLVKALSGISNIAIVGQKRVCLGFTSDRVVFNSELFEKCAKAYVIARSTGQKYKKVPGWVCKIAGGRLKKDQQKSADAYAVGKIPEGMNAY